MRVAAAAAGWHGWQQERRRHEGRELQLPELQQPQSEKKVGTRMLSGTKKQSRRLVAHFCLHHEDEAD